MTEVKRASDESRSEIHRNGRKQTFPSFSATSKRLGGLADALLGLLIESQFTDDSRIIIFFLFHMWRFLDEGGPPVSTEGHSLKKLQPQLLEFSTDDFISRRQFCTDGRDAPPLLKIKFNNLIVSVHH